MVDFIFAYFYAGETDGDAELASLPEYHNFMIPEGYHWNDVRTKSENIGKHKTCPETNFATGVFIFAQGNNL